MQRPIGKTTGLLVAILVGGLLGVGLAVDGEAQTADPVGLIASAAIQPFWAQPPFFTIFEITSLEENPAMHVFFFSATCQRVFSIPFRMSAHDATIVDTTELHLSFNGLAVFSKSENGISATGLEGAITLRGHRVDFLFDVINVVDPISARNAEDPTRTWNPLRSGASTVTFPDSAPFSTTRWWVVCPQGNLPIDLGSGIPKMPPAPSLVRFRAFDLDENFVFDQQFTCNCLTEIIPGQLNAGFFAEPRYVEMVSTLDLALPKEKPDDTPAFVLYRQLRFGPIGGFAAEDFARAPGMSAATILTGEPVVGAR